MIQTLGKPVFMSLVISVLALCVTSADAEARTYNALSTRQKQSSTSGLKLQPAIGYVSSSWSGAHSDYGTFSSNSGYTAGMNAILGGEAPLTFSTGLFYAERGITYRGRLVNSYGMQVINDGEIKYSMKYLEIPAYARYAFYRQGNLQLLAKAGVVLALLQSSSTTKENKSSNSYYQNNSWQLDQTNLEKTTGQNPSKTDLRWSAGLGSAYRFSRQASLTFDFIYERSLSAISSSSSSSAYTTGYALSAGVLWSL